MKKLYFRLMALMAAMMSSMVSMKKI